MLSDYFAGASALATIKAPSAVAADGHSPGVDLAPFNGALAMLLSVANTAGTTPTMDVKLQQADDVDVVGAVSYSGTGNGTLTELWGGPDSVAENITVTFSSATDFAVAGSVTGAIGTGTVGTRFISPQLSFLAFAGTTAFVNTDAFTVTVSARSYADIAGATFTRATTGAGFQRLKIESDPLGRYLRAALDIGGTNNPAYTLGLALLGMKQS